MMNTKDKLIFSITNMIIELAAQISNHKQITYPNKDSYLINFIGADKIELVNIITIVINELPQEVFLATNLNIQSIIQLLIIRELPLLLSLEDKNSPYFKSNLINFTYELVHLITNNLYVPNHTTTQI